MYLLELIRVSIWSSNLQDVKYGYQNSLFTLKDGLLISALDAYNPIDFINQLSVGEYDVKQFSAMLGFCST